MLFRPRHPPPWSMRLRLALWPRRGFARSARYVGLRIMRLGATPQVLALGVAAGVFVATLPIPGLQMLAAACLAWSIGGNVPAALLATFWANPLTLPLLWLSSHGIGKWLIGDGMATTKDVLEALSRVMTLAGPGGSFGRAYDALLPLLKPLALGGIVLGAACAAIAYVLTVRIAMRRRSGPFVEPSRRAA